MSNPDDRVDAARQQPEQAESNQEAGQSQQDPTVRTGEAPVSGQTVPSTEEAPGARVPAASETWVEGQATSDADYQEKDEPAE